MKAETELLEVVQLGYDAGKNPDPSVYTFSPNDNILLITFDGVRFEIIDRKYTYIIKMVRQFDEAIKYIQDEKLNEKYGQIWYETEVFDKKGKERSDCMAYPIFLEQPESFADLLIKKEIGDVIQESDDEESTTDKEDDGSGEDEIEEPYEVEEI